MEKTILFLILVIIGLLFLVFFICKSVNKDSETIRYLTSQNEHYKKRYSNRQSYINEQQNIKMNLLMENDKLKAELVESIANREHKSKRINQLMIESKQWELKFNKAMSFWQQDRDSKYKALLENKKLISRNAELQQWNDKLCAKIEQYDKILKAYDKSQVQSTGHCLSGNYKVTIETLNKKKRK